MDNSQLNPFKYAARKLKMEGFRPEWNPYSVYLRLIECFRRMDSTKRIKIGFEAASLLAHLLLLRQPLSFLTYICVSDYVGGTRFKAQEGGYVLTAGENLMLERASRLQEEARNLNVHLTWRLILADGWGIELFGDRCEPGALDLYCKFMESELRTRKFEAVRWSSLMFKHREIYQQACADAESPAEEFATREAERGEIAHDKPSKTEARRLARQHIQMRAAEGKVVLQEYGPTLVLSTETRKLTRYDNLLVSKENYTHLFVMPFYPHRLS